MAGKSIYFSNLIICYFVLFHYRSVISYSLNGNILQDLTSTDGNFIAEADAWTASTLVDSSIKTTMCNDTILLGGYGILGSATSQSGDYFQRTYNSLPPHNIIYFQMTFWVIDGWEGTEEGDTFEIWFDTTKLTGWQFRKQDTVLPNICGMINQYEIPAVTIQGNISHQLTSLTFKVVSKLNQDSTDESFGFRDLKLAFDTISPAPSTSAICARSPTILPDSRKCGCPVDQFEQPANSGNCLPCDSSCASCSGALATQCLSCVKGTYFSSNQCLVCHSSCVACNGAGYSACTECSSGKYLSANQCLSCHSSCATCTAGTSNSCSSCPAGRYKSGTQCPACHSSCATCTGSSANECTSCPLGSFLVNNNTCVTTCNSPLIQTVNGTVKYCESPCSSSNKYLYWDRSCADTCDIPLLSSMFQTFKLCNYNCTATEYLYWNGTCGSQCLFPLKNNIQLNKNFCVHPCKASEYLYWNGSCSDSCVFPLKAKEESGKKYCNNPCTTDQYLLWNQTCVTTCPVPLNIKLEGGVRYCNFPCNLDEYAQWNGSCIQSCNSPLVIRTEGGTNYPRNFCDLSCSSSEYMYWNNMCSNTCNSPLRNSTWNGKSLCLQPCESYSPYYFEDQNICGKTCESPRTIDESGLYAKCRPGPKTDQGGALLYYLLNAPTKAHEYTLVTTDATLQYLHYLDIPMPERFQKLANSTGKSFLSPRFGIYAPASITPRRILEGFIKYPLPNVFERNGLHSSFIVNFWDTWTTLAILITIAVSLVISERLLRKTSLRTLHGIVERLKIMACFNYLLLIFISSIDEIILYGSLEFRTFYQSFGESGATTVSFLISLLMIFFVIQVIGLTIIKVKKASNSGAYVYNSENSDNYINFAIKWRWCQVLIRGFKSDTIYNKLFFLIYILRINIPVLITCILVDYPLVQTIFQVLFNLAILVYLIWKKPIEKKLSLVQLILYEAIYLVINIFILVIVICAVTDVDVTSGGFVVIADIVIVGTTILNLMRFVFLIIKIKVEADVLKLIKKECPEKGNAIWVNLLGVLAQQTGIGFEEIIDEKCISSPSIKYLGLVDSQIVSQVPKEKKTKKQKVYPNEMAKEIDPFFKKNDTSKKSDTPLATSMLLTTSEVNQNKQNLSEEPTNLRSRVKNMMLSLKQKKNMENDEKESPDLSPTAFPTFSIDLSDNSPTQNKGVSSLLKKGSSIEKLSPTKQSKAFFNEDSAVEDDSRPISNHKDTKKLLNLIALPSASPSPDDVSNRRLVRGNQNEDQDPQRKFKF